MDASQDIFGILRRSNPWWGGVSPRDLPDWRRAAFAELLTWVVDPPAHRAVLLSGARQVGKTTLLLQIVEELLRRGVSPTSITYVSLDHPLLKPAGLERLVDIRAEFQPAPDGIEYLLLDEIQNAPDWAVWVKHQTDFNKRRRLLITGSTLPLQTAGEESGVGRLHTIRLPTLSFAEFMRLRDDHIPQLPILRSLTEPFTWSSAQRARVAEESRALAAPFHEYLLRGGFPGTANIDSLDRAQQLLREDIVDRVLRRDMTAVFGIRRPAELEQLFLYFCRTDGGITNAGTLASHIGISEATVNSYISHLEAAHLIYRLPQLLDGKASLRARPKIYLADPALAGSVLLKGRSLLEDAQALGRTVEGAFFKHAFTHFYRRSMGFYYWLKARPDVEVDLVAQLTDQMVPFEVKYTRGSIHSDDLRGLRAFIDKYATPRAYLITQNPTDFSVCDPTGAPIAEAAAPGAPRILKLPAPLACYWLSMIELHGDEDQPPTSKGSTP